MINSAMKKPPLPGWSEGGAGSLGAGTLGALDGAGVACVDGLGAGAGPVSRFDGGAGNGLVPNAGATWAMYFENCGPAIM